VRSYESVRTPLEMLSTPLAAQTWSLGTDCTSHADPNIFRTLPERAINILKYLQITISSTHSERLKQCPGVIQTPHNLNLIIATTKAQRTQGLSPQTRNIDGNVYADPKQVVSKRTYRS
jgi:hypothetical protein